MQDIHPRAAAAGEAGSSGFSYAATARQGLGGGAGVPAVDDRLGDGFDAFDDEDPELAAALAASLEDHNGNQQQHQNLQKQEGQPGQQQRGQALPDVPEEPTEGADGAITVAFRLPSGARLSRRFSTTDTVAVAQAYLVQHLISSGEMRQGQRVQLSTQFPKKILDQGEAELAAAGVEDRSMLSVQIC